MSPLVATENASDSRSEDKEIPKRRKSVSSSASVDGTNTGNITPEKTDLHRQNDKDGKELHYVEGWKLFSLLFAVITSVFVVLLDMIIIVTAIPRITSTFHSLPDVGWYGAAYNLSR